MGVNGSGHRIEDIRLALQSGHSGERDVLAALSILACRHQSGQNGPNGLQGYAMKSMSAKEAKNGFGLLLDTARAEPVVIEKHGRPVVVVLSVEQYQRLTGDKEDRTTETPEG